MPSTSGRRCSSTSTEPSSGVTKWHTGFLRFSKSGRGEGETASLRQRPPQELRLFCSHPAPQGGPLRVLSFSFPWKMRFQGNKGVQVQGKESGSDVWARKGVWLIKRNTGLSLGDPEHTDLL